MTTKKTKTPAVRKRTTRQLPYAPAIVHHLIDSYVLGDLARVDGAYAHAARILRSPNQVDSVAQFVEPGAEQQLKKFTPEVLDSEVWGDHAGAIYSAIMGPSFCVGFSVAHLLFSEQAGTHPEFFERLRVDALYSAFRSLDERRQRQVIRLANQLAMQRTREGKRRKNVRPLTSRGGAR